MLTDAHVHLFDLHAISRGLSSLPADVMACASAHAEEEFRWQESFARSRVPAGSSKVGRVVLSFGVHPQEPDFGGIAFLETLVRDGRVDAVGECGFDLFSEKFARSLEAQKKAWDAQLSIAESSGLPLVVHCRKALHLVFADAARLRRVSSVAFHGWPGSANEADSLLNRGVNAYFCAGKALLRGDRSLVGTLRSVSPNRILIETDAPYMKAAGEEWSDPGSIAEIAARAAETCGVAPGEFESRAEASFRSFFRIRP